MICGNLYMISKIDQPELSSDSKFLKQLKPELNGSYKSSSILCWINRFKSFVFMRLSCSSRSKVLICSRSATMLLFPSTPSYFSTPMPNSLRGLYVNYSCKFSLRFSKPRKAGFCSLS